MNIYEQSAELNKKSGCFLSFTLFVKLKKGYLC